MAKIGSIREGRRAPAFDLKDKDGRSWSLKKTEGCRVVYFYPKDSTPGCTLEAMGFNRLRRQFADLGVTVLGISGGDERSKEKFCVKHKLSIPLLSDTDFLVSKAYGVYGPKVFMGRAFDGINRRTFVVDAAGKVLKVYEKVNPLKHPEEVLRYVSEVLSGSRPQASRSEGEAARPNRKPAGAKGGTGRR